MNILGGGGLVAKSFLTLFNLMNCSPPGFSVYRILQARILKWVAIPSSREIFLTEESNLSLSCLPASEGRFFTTSATWEAQGPLILTKSYVREAFLFPASVPLLTPPPSLLSNWPYYWLGRLFIPLN